MSSNAKYFIAAVILLIGVVGVSFFSCEKEEIVPNMTTPSEDPTQLEADAGNTIRVEPIEDIDMPELGENCGKVFTKKLKAAGNETVGNVIVYNDDEVYRVQISATRGWYFGRAYAQIAYDMAKFPLDRDGNPDYTHFDHAVKDPQQKKVVEFNIPFSRIELEQFMTSIAVEVTSDPERPGKRMIGWVEGKEYGAKQPGTAFIYKRHPCLTIDGTENTAAE